MNKVEDILKSTKNRMDKSIEALKKELSIIRTGRASIDLVQSINAHYYGASTPINQLSSITIPEARTILIQPWDKNALIEIEKAILQSNIGINPTNDGDTIRLNVPPLTEERRKEMVKSVSGIIEKGNVSIRNIRRDTLEKIRTMEKSKEVSQDDSRTAQQDLRKITDSYVSITEILKNTKEKELMKI